RLRQKDREGVLSKGGEVVRLDKLSSGIDEFGIEAFNSLLGELATNEETGICSVSSGVSVLFRPEIRARSEQSLAI
ncbi:hypothetical protein L249_5522, partial [Ophiocordyceps polyrhachis-furcata BCC 54312]